MDQTEPPAIVKMLLLVGVPSLFVLFGLVLIAFIILPMVPSAKIGGVKFFFPRRAIFFDPAWAKGLSKEFILGHIEKYAALMPEAFRAIGVDGGADKIRICFAQVRCHLSLGYLHDQFRKDDLNDDGKPDLITGLTYSPDEISVGVIDAVGMLPNGKLDLARTAFTYELHNAVVWALAGYEVSLGEAFVAANDTRLLPFLNGKTIAEMKTKRAVLDAAFYAIKE